MKKSLTCPKCKSQDIIRIPGRVGEHFAGNNIPTGWTSSSAVKVTRYLCGNCGFIEEWIESSADIQKVRKKFGK